MLLLKSKTDTVWVTHEESGAQFEIKPMDSEQREALERKSQKADGLGVDFRVYARNFAAEYLVNWKGVGDRSGELPCNVENRAQFASAHAITIMPWLIGRAASLDNFRNEEIAAAKNA